MNNDEQRKAEEILELASRIGPLLAGRQPEVQSGALAELTAKWVLGFQIPGDMDATADIQAHVLAGHIKLIMDLIGCQAAVVHEQVQTMLQRN